MPLLQSVRRRTKPTTVNLYEVFCAVLYLLRSGCQWRMLPRDFAEWSEPDPHGSSVLERALKNQVDAVREKMGRNAQPRRC